MKILCLEEHIQCKDFIENKQFGFTHYSLKSNESLSLSGIQKDKILFVLEGSLNLNLSNEQNIIVQSGRMIAFSDQENLEIYATTNSRILVLFVVPKIINQLEIIHELFLSNYEIESLESPKILFFRRPLNLMLDMTYLELDSGIYCMRLNVLKQTEFFKLLSVLYSKEELSTFLNPLFSSKNDFKSEISKHLDKATSVEELAHLMGMDIKKFTWLFRKMFDDKPISWLNKRRNLQIESYLKDKSMLLKDIADKMGFSSNAHFSTYCKKHFGKTPKEYRKELLRDVSL